MYNDQQVVIILPAYNEGSTIYRIIRRVLKQKEVDKILVVDDGSVDNTLEEAVRAAKTARGRIRLIRNGSNMGKGYSVRRAIEAVKPDNIIILQDADEEYYPEDYRVLLKAFGGSGPVFGYRKRNQGNQYALALFANNVHTWFFNTLYNQSIRDVNVCYKVFKRSMLKGRTLTQNGFAIEEEIAVTLAKNGYRIKEVPIRYKGRTFSEGKKIGAKAAIGDLLFLIGSRFS